MFLVSETALITNFSVADVPALDEHHRRRAIMSARKGGAVTQGILYRDHYFHDSAARESFEEYAKQVFGLDFALWKDKGLWEDRYVAFSAFDGGQCVASLCVYPNEVMLRGRRTRAGQLLTVGTLPEFRRRGIQRELWRRASAWLRETMEFAFLFTDESASGFYERLGLKRQRESLVSVDISSADVGVMPTGEVRKLDLSSQEDFLLISRLAHERAFVSHELGLRNPHQLLFMFLYEYGSSSYYVPALDCVVVAERGPDQVRLHDVVAPVMPSFAALVPFLARFNVPRVELLFTPDLLGLGHVDRLPVTDHVLFVTDGVDLPEPVLFPFSAAT
jgi:ribosomal protein S18 acetylase RimI-like enzyme